MSTHEKKDAYVPSGSFISHMKSVAKHVGSWSESKRVIVQSTITGSTTIVNITTTEQNSSLKFPSKDDVEK